MRAGLFHYLHLSRYNDSGQLEVYGFADPIWDAKEADTSLWSSNLQKVPADLSVEKSKFLLGQVGYKFCELFHQEKEAYYEHMAEGRQFRFGWCSLSWPVSYVPFLSQIPLQIKP